jgi:molybdopterin-guanine dinucleotide biosynthesis protein A
MTPGILGLVLAGGLSSRMGRDKAALVFAGAPLSLRALSRLRPQVSLVAFNGSGIEGLPADIPSLPDTVAGHQGPLAGVLAGLRHAEGLGIGNVVSVPVDAPFFPLDLVSRLWKALGDDTSRIAVAASGGTLHPVFGLWPTHLADDLEHFVTTDAKRRVRGFIERHPHVIVDFPLAAMRGGLETVDPFLNMNRPEDVARAEQLLDDVLAPNEDGHS